MATFLELCQQLHREVGVAGSITQVTGQTGHLLRLVEYIKKANRKIQLRKGNWNFLWGQWDLTTVASTSTYSGPDSLGSFDESSFWYQSGSSDAQKMGFIEYREYRDAYKNVYLDSGMPQFVTIRPDGKVLLIPTPSSTYASKTISADYWKSYVDITANGSLSPIPSQFHDIIVAQAKVYWAEKVHDNGLYQAAIIEHEDLYTALKAHSLPGKQDENRSESSLSRVITVE